MRLVHNHCVHKGVRYILISTFRANMCDHHHLRSGTPSGDIDLINFLSEQLGDLYVSSEYTDISFIVDDKTIFHAHKVILAARSEYFRAMLYGGLLESQPGTTEVQLPGTSAIAFSAILKYIYTGRMNLLEMREEHLTDILGLAHQYGFVQLETAVSDFLKAILNIRNVCLIYDLANMYNLKSLYSTCVEFIDRNALEILQSESFPLLSQSSVCELICRDSFCAGEIQIFRAVCNWANHNTGRDPSPILEAVRLPQLTMDELLNVVRPTGLVSPDAILDAIKVRTESRDIDLRYRGFLIPEENVATSRFNAQVVHGEMKAALLDGDIHTYDLDRGFTRHPVDDNNGQGIVIKLGQPYIVNSMKILLWDRDERSYSYYVEVSMNDNDYVRIIDHSQYLCRSLQVLHFLPRVVRYIRIVGTHNTVNRVFHVVSLECFHTTKTFKLIDGLIVPSENIASAQNSACVTEGVSRSRNALINGDIKHYDWDSGYTCHQLGSGAIVVQLSQPYLVDSVRLLLWDCDDRRYSYYVEVSVDNSKWLMVADKRNERCKSWQVIRFPARPVTFIKIVGTHNTANEVFHVVHFECPVDPATLSSSLMTVVADPSTPTSSAVTLQGVVPIPMVTSSVITQPSVHAIVSVAPSQPTQGPMNINMNPPPAGAVGGAAMGGAVSIASPPLLALPDHVQQMPRQLPASPVLYVTLPMETASVASSDTSN